MATDVHSFYTTSTSQHVKSHPQRLVDSFISHYSQASNSSDSKTATLTTTRSAPAMNSIAIKPTNIPSPAIISSLSPPTTHTTYKRPAVAYPQKGIIKRIVDRVRLEYYRYEVTYGVYVMGTGEKLATNGFVLIVLGLMMWALFLYFPSLIYQKLSRLDWLLTGRDVVTLRNVTLPLSNQTDAPVSLIRLPQL